MSRDDTAVVVVDVQDKLVNVVPDGDRVVWNIQRLARGAEVLGIPLFATEQYPEKLGPTAKALSGFISNAPSKMSFSCCGSADFETRMKSLEVYKVLVAGLESHVCVMQTCLDLLAAGYEVYVCVDAIAARFDVDHEISLRRMESNGVTLTTTEMALFEWCEVSGTPEFKKISEIVRSVPS